VVKPVSFNITKEDDAKMLKQLEGKNFSGYVKELIKADLIKRESEFKIVQKTTGGGIKIVIGER
jgi:hypothetical protein